MIRDYPIYGQITIKDYNIQKIFLLKVISKMKMKEKINSEVSVRTGKTGRPLASPVSGKVQINL